MSYARGRHCYSHDSSSLRKMCLCTSSSWRCLMHGNGCSWTLLHVSGLSMRTETIYILLQDIECTVSPGRHVLVLYQNTNILAYKLDKPNIQVKEEPLNLKVIKKTWARWAQALGSVKWNVKQKRDLRPWKGHVTYCSKQQPILLGQRLHHNSSLHHSFSYHCWERCQQVHGLELKT